MNWFDKIKEITTKQDKSPELKKGEIKQILIQVAYETLPDFEFLAYKNGAYVFQRKRQANGWTVYETFYLIFSLKDKNFACSISSRLTPIDSNQFCSGPLNTHVDLKSLRHNSSALNIQDAYYFHNGQVETTTKVVKEIFGDYKKYGLHLLDKHLDILKTKQLITSGLDYITKLSIPKSELKRAIADELELNNGWISTIKHPVFLDLKEKLQELKEVTKDERKLIRNTTLQLLEVYWTNENNWR